MDVDEIAVHRKISALRTKFGKIDPRIACVHLHCCQHLLKAEKTNNSVFFADLSLVFET
jgi:hypothetical protein